MSKGIKKLIVDLFMKFFFSWTFFNFASSKTKLKTNSLKDLIKISLKELQSRVRFPQRVRPTG
jgi:hypothetical protein